MQMTSILVTQHLIGRGNMSLLEASPGYMAKLYLKTTTYRRLGVGDGTLAKMLAV